MFRESVMLINLNGLNACPMRDVCPDIERFALEFRASPPRGQNLMLAATLQRNAVEMLHDTGASRVLLSGKSFIADPTGALYWPAENTLVTQDRFWQDEAPQHA